MRPVKMKTKGKYDILVLIMVSYLVDINIWEAVEEDYEVVVSSNIPTMALLKYHKEKKVERPKQIMSFAGV